MKTSLLLLVLLTLAAPLFCAEPLTIHDDDAGFTPLFNGKDLTGWEGAAGFWSAQDGAIRGQTTAEHPAKQNTFLVWRGGTLKNFILKLRFRLQNGNSGVQYRSKEMNDFVVAGYQAEVENTPGKVGFLYHEQGRGWLVNVGDFMEIAPDNKQTVITPVNDVKQLIEKGYYKNKDWNQYTIICRGNHIVHYLNGYQTIELIDNDTANRLSEGILALQIHTGDPMVVEFKDIRLMNLPENYGQAIRLFNGKDLAGWTGSSPEQKPVWGVKDGVLTDTGKPAGYLRTEKDYTNFVLRLQMRHLAPGNCGVLLRMVGEDKIWPRSIEAQGMYQNKGDIYNIDKFPMKSDPARTNDRRVVKMHPTNEPEVGGWNEYEIYLNGGDLRLIVNGLLQNTLTECWETPGKIALQSEGAPVEFRNIVLIPIEPKPKQP